MKKSILIIIIAFIYGCKKDNKELKNISSLDYLKGDSLFRQDNDSAFFYYNLVATNSSDRLEKARAFNRMATMQFNTGDHFGSQETVTESQKLLDEEKQADHPYLLSNYNLLGRSYLEQKNYDAAINSFKKAEDMQEKGKVNSTLLNNLAVAYQKKMDYSTSKSLFELVIDNSKKDTLVYARALSNLARTKWLEDPSYHAASELLLALNLREQKNERNGLNASYSHLADYYLNTQPDSSLLYAKKMYQVAQSPDDKLESIEKIIEVGSPKDVKDYSKIYYKINDSLEVARSATKNQFAAIRFETEKNKAENLRLQQNNIKQQVYIYTITIGFIILLGGGVTLYSKRKKRIERESLEKIRENQLKTSKKVHDVVANGLYQIMTDLEHRDQIDREPLLDKIEVLYEQSRDISYDQPVHQYAEYANQIHNLLSSYGTTYTKILIAGNQEIIWKKLSAFEKKELEYVLQELMINMSRHSQAQNVAIRFVEEGDRFNVYYKDDGIGLHTPFEFGNGLRNTENRIKNMKGTIIFDGMTGLKIEISLPIGKTND